MKNTTKYIFGMSEATAETLAHLIFLTATGAISIGLYALIIFLS